MSGFLGWFAALIGAIGFALALLVFLGIRKFIRYDTKGD